MTARTARTVLVAAALAGTSLLTAGPATADGGALTATPHGEARKALPAPSTPAQVTGATTSAVPGAVSGAAAAAVGFRVFDSVCLAGNVLFTADTYETGFSGVRRFRHKAQLQEFTARGWVNRSPMAFQPSTRFPNDGRSFHFARDWNGAHVANGASWRVKWQGQYLNGSDQVIAQTNWITVTCA